MIKERKVNHQTLYAAHNSADWKPLAKLPVPRIPTFVPEDPPHKTEWLQESRREWRDASGMTIYAMIGRGRRTEEAFCIWKMHGPKSSVPGTMYMTWSPDEESLQKMLADGSIELDTPCAKENGVDWLTVKDFL